MPTTVNGPTQTTFRLYSGKVVNLNAVNGVGQLVQLGEPGTPDPGVITTLTGTTTPIGPLAVDTTFRLIVTDGSIIYDFQNGGFVDQVARNLAASGPKRSAGARWRRALSRVLLGSASATLFCLGDSTTAGMGSNGALFTNARVNSYPQLLTSLLNKRQANIAESDTWLGDANVTAGGSSLPAYNPSITLGAGWSPNVPTMGGQMMGNNSTTNPIAWTPSLPVDTVDVYYAILGGLGSFTVDVGGGALATINQAGSQALGKQTVSLGSLAAQTINFKRVSGQVYIIGAHAYNSTVKRVAVMNAGASGWTSTNWQYSGAFDALGAAANVGADLYIIDLLINDYNTANPSSQVNMEKIVSTLIAVGDVLLVVPVPSAATQVPVATQEQYRNIARNPAAKHGTMLVDLSTDENLSSYEISNPLGLYFDTLHLNGLGYAGKTQSIERAIRF